MADSGSDGGGGSFDSLPDSVAAAILSKLRNAQAVAQCSTVSRRWRVLCRSVDTLAFESFALFENKGVSKASWLEAIVSQMLLHSNGVRDLSISYHPVVWPWILDDHFTQDSVCLWLDHVANSLEKLMLVDPNRCGRPQPNKLVRLAACRRLGWLNLCYGVLTEVPPGLSGFYKLQTCVLDLIVVNDAALETLVRLCPLLQHLRVNSCKGLDAPSLVAPRLVRLEFVYEMDMCERTIACLSLDAPCLTTMSLSCVEELVTDGEALLELGLLGHVRPRIRDLSYLRDLHMKGQIWQLESILELVRLGVNVKQLHVDAVIENKSPIQLHAFFHHLPSLKVVYIGADMFECMEAGAATMTSCLQNIWLPRLEEITAVVCHGNQACISVLLALIRCSSSLVTLRINARELRKGVGNEHFFTDVLYLQREFPNVKISLDCPYSLL